MAGAEARITRIETLAENWHPLRLLHIEQRRRDGTQQSLAREVYDNGQGAVVLPFDAGRGTVLLIRQLRPPALLVGEEPMLVEACAGVVEDGRTPEETVRAEAEQEMGIRLHAVRFLFTLFTSPGATAERLHHFLGAYDEGSRTGAGGGLREEGEEIELLELPLDEAWAMVVSGGIRDSKTVLLLQHLRLGERP
jgi:nudix-type nucleoside diphosphatase (YffH/AdpP family)